MNARVVCVHFAILTFLAVPGFAISDYCIGDGCASCGSGWHLHCLTSDGTECWDQVDSMCDPYCDFSRPFTDPCGGGDDPASAAAAGTVAPVVFGGYNLFMNEIRQTATPPIAMKAQAGAVFDTMQGAVERQAWEVPGAEGNTDGLRLGWAHQSESNWRYSAVGSYQTSEADGGGPELTAFNGDFSIGSGIGSSGIWRWSANAKGSDVSNGTSATLYGAGTQVYFNTQSKGGAVFSGGVTYQFTDSSDLADPYQVVGYGLAYGIPIGQRFTVDLDGYGMTVIEPDVIEDQLYYLGATFGVFFTESFALNLGYRTLQGVEDLDVNTISLGAWTRW